MDGRSQVLLDVRMIQVAHTSTRNTGAQLPQSMSAFNVYAEEQSILNANQSLVQEIISSGLASPNDPLAILAVLIASGQVSSSLLSGGFAVFGGGIGESALVPGSAAFNLDLNTSDSRELDQIQLQLKDGEEGTIKEGEKYPIQTSRYSSSSPNSAAIAGLTSAGTSSSLTSLLSSLTSSAVTIPMVQYQDLGLTLKATPRVLRNGDVALSIDMKLDALSGQSVDGNPVLNNRAYSGVVTIKEGECGSGGDRGGQIAEPGRERNAGDQRDSGAERCDKQGLAEKLCDAHDPDNAARDSRHAGGGSHGDDARGERPVVERRQTTPDPASGTWDAPIPGRVRY